MASSDDNNHRSRTQDVPAESDLYPEDIPNNMETEGRRLLSDDHLDENRGPGRPVSQTRRIGCAFVGMFVMFVVVIFGLAGVLLSFNPSKPSAQSAGHDDHDDSAPKQPVRSNDRYILDPAWDFLAPSQVREYQWTITDGQGSPDGVHRPMMLINDQFPGPLIEINEGDVLVVKLVNKASNATALHWHGMFQNGTNWMDGAAGVTQCPIAPGQSYEYRFNVTGQSGTYFYHGHQGVQALDGLVGPMVVHSHREAAKPYTTDRVVLLQDWWYDPASGHMRDVLFPGVEDAPIPNTALMNGINQAVCSDHPDRKCTEVKAASLPHLDVAPGERHRLRFINAGGFAWFQVAVDEHDDLQVVEVDGTIVEPTLASPLVISPGQRYSAVLKADHDNGSFWLRARMVTACFAEQNLPENGIEEAKAIVHYTRSLHARHGDHEDEDEDDDDDDDNAEDSEEEELMLPQTTSEMPFLKVCRDLNPDISFKPSPQQSAPQIADHSWYFRVNLAIGDWRLQRGVFNSSSFRPSLKYPTLHRVLDGLADNNKSFTVEGINTAAFNAESELVISNNKLETVDVILQNMDENSHPFHLHGTKMWVLGQGHGYFPGYEALGFKPDGKGILDAANTTMIRNPLKRDTITAEGYGWVLIRFVADNPGVWLFHCHVIWHSEAGMGMQFVSRLDDLRGVQVPDEARKLCDAPEEELRKGAPPKDEVFFGFGDDERRRSRSHATRFKV
ncbi:multicopper oxidase-domain-containing protein [Xylaria bambusicola]|uniref:multicopper oxidase-domain-containing protein n=1 Tax=Xylaria bambusicola TaxID=326684 RepID=UPI002008368A|nr:multicopper oxidase-domain-containing protein [Xylaria bambusicola]KAI0506852.1 multicopper oxidase-domain-containing protein [Xylaria bambusicola]